MAEDLGLAGQWIGESDDGRPASVIVDLDDGPVNVRGSARLFFKDESPGAICEFELPRLANTHNLPGTVLFWMPSGVANMLNTEQMRAAQPSWEIPTTADIDLFRSGDQLLVRWRTDLGTHGSAALGRSLAHAPSELNALNVDWSGFKEFVLRQPPETFIFRGQPDPRKLRTAFHRTHRKDLVKYTSTDIPLAHKQLTARTKHLFNLQDRQQAGAFYNLLQHHGYPTPLLDWSYSPFVAAFFAYRRRAVDEAGVVRILAFNKALWMARYAQLEAVNFAQPHFSMLEALAIENPRAIPQQAISTLTNIDDIENYIRAKEVECKQQLIHAIDLPACARSHVMAELSLMGITAGSLFPGLDGACEELVGRMFHHQVAPVDSN